MSHPVLRVAAVVLAVIAVVAGLKLFGLAPDDVFSSRRHGDGIDIFGAIHVHDESRSWLHPLLLTHILSVPALWQLCRRLGYTGWFSLAMLVPLANILLLYFLAFAAWPLGQRQSDGPLGATAAQKDETVVVRRDQFTSADRPRE